MGKIVGLTKELIAARKEAAKKAASEVKGEKAPEKKDPETGKKSDRRELHGTRNMGAIQLPLFRN